MNMAHERSLRVLMLIGAAVATPFLIPTTIISLNSESRYYYDHRTVTTFCFAYFPLALTALASTLSLLHYRKYGRSPGHRFAHFDAFASALYLGVLGPIWGIEVDRISDGGYGLLVGYLTAPMILNMIIHFYCFVYNARSAWVAFSNRKTHECPNCHQNFVSGPPQVRQTAQDPSEYSLLRGETYLDENAVPYSNARSSDDQIRPESDEKGESKGKAALDV
ncbi:uncharacterized protein K460DRAFT_397520 [Cucurbitaria berberidis CBS 394.84]|uniref:Uncharacterized protein n=1 Tax=Cucurbitaria berberidis CBS 394.84 TaxID=1168544 RepID=A0A9P4GFR8_9PLEO|nr:uncharacterized protein K460DRAFT_397520 [Cucurbitaria berberidis CBS 394.84]KAF1844419.1 hypothetical protein K460DRAFT_397520 [Cucurbitaria berberidis CBS 394.84]